MLLIDVWNQIQRANVVVPWIRSWMLSLILTHFPQNLKSLGPVPRYFPTNTRIFLVLNLNKILCLNKGCHLMHGTLSMRVIKIGNLTTHKVSSGKHPDQECSRNSSLTLSSHLAFQERHHSRSLVLTHTYATRVNQGQVHNPMESRYDLIVDEPRLS